jgi:hypothetical protein
MPKKMRHSKFRNTGILFELLTRQITADIIAGKDDSEAKDLLFRYFKENTELGKEWRLYNFLLSEKIKDESHAERFLSVIVEQRKKLSNPKLSKEKYELIKEIKELYPIEDFLKANIKNYRTLASIFKLFENACSKDLKFDVKEIYQAKTCIVENIVDRPKKAGDEEDILKFYAQQNEEIRLLSYKMLVESMNKKYKDLDENQKSVLREYINNVSNTNSLGAYLIKEVDNVKKQLGELASKIQDDDVIKIKINEVVRQLDKVKPSPNKVVKDNQVMVVLLSYELLKEIKKQVEGKNDDKKITT